MMETFELCKKLYELKPHWKPEDKLVIWNEGDEPEIVSVVNSARRFDEAPRFTTDYLLEKLPKVIDGGSDDGILTLVVDEIEYGEHNWGWGWRASYNSVNSYLVDDLVHEAKDPLHAVLKLAIAVAELERKGIIK